MQQDKVRYLLYIDEKSDIYDRQLKILSFFKLCEQIYFTSASSNVSVKQHLKRIGELEKILNCKFILFATDCLLMDEVKKTIATKGDEKYIRRHVIKE